MKTAPQPGARPTPPKQSPLDVFRLGGQQAYEYLRLMRFDRPIGIWLLMWPTLWALWISSNGAPDQNIFIVLVLGTIIMRSAGCVMNDYADRNIDPRVKRTQDRPLATGAVTPIEALVLFAGLGLIAIGLVLTLNRLTQGLAVIGALVTLIYPFMKRFIATPQVIMGVAFAWGVPMAFAAQTNSTPRAAWLLFLAALLWAVVYDTMYAMVDREDDVRIGVKSTAILFADADRFIVMVMQLMFLGCLYLVGEASELGVWYRVGLLGAACLALYQQYLIRHREPAACFQAFLNNRHLGAVVFAGIFLEFTFRS